MGGELPVVLDDVGGVGVGRDQPKHRVRAVQCCADRFGVGVAAGNDVDLLAHLLR